MNTLFFQLKTVIYNHGYNNGTLKHPSIYREWGPSLEVDSAGSGLVVNAFVFFSIQLK